MTTVRRSSRRIPRLAAATAATAVALALLAACGSSSDDDSKSATPKSSDTSASSSSPTAASADSTAVPTQDVVSSIAADPALKAELPANIQSSGKIILGTARTVGTTGLPHAGIVDGKEVGVDLDLRAAVAKVLGITWDVQYGTFPTIIPGVQNGKYDVGASNFGVTKAREQVVDFATYLNDGQSFLAAKRVPIDSATQLTDLCGLTIATSPGSTFQQILTDGASKCSDAGKKPYKVQYFADQGPIFLGLANGKVDIFFGPTLGLKYDATHVPNTKYLGQISTTAVGFTTKKGSPLGKALSDAVNKLISTGDYQKIFAKWGVPETGVTKSEINPTPNF